MSDKQGRREHERSAEAFLVLCFLGSLGYFVRASKLPSKVGVEDTPDHGPNVRLALQVGQALDELDQRGFIHGDVSPANIVMRGTSH